MAYKGRMRQGKVQHYPPESSVTSLTNQESRIFMGRDGCHNCHQLKRKFFKAVQYAKNFGNKAKILSEQQVKNEKKYFPENQFILTLEHVMVKLFKAIEHAAEEQEMAYTITIREKDQQIVKQYQKIASLKERIKGLEKGWQQQEHLLKQQITIKKAEIKELDEKMNRMKQNHHKIKDMVHESWVQETKRLKASYEAKFAEIRTNCQQNMDRIYQLTQNHQIWSNHNSLVFE